MDEDARARNRLLLIPLVRFAGLAIFFLGIAIMYTNLLRPGGWPQVGAIIAILGVIDAFLRRACSKKAWDRAGPRQAMKRFWKDGDGRARTTAAGPIGSTGGR